MVTGEHVQLGPTQVQWPPVDRELRHLVVSDESGRGLGLAEQQQAVHHVGHQDGEAERLPLTRHAVAVRCPLDRVDPVPQPQQPQVAVGHRGSHRDAARRESPSIARCCACARTASASSTRPSSSRAWPRSAVSSSTASRSPPSSAMATARASSSSSVPVAGAVEVSADHELTDGAGVLGGWSAGTLEQRHRPLHRGRAGGLVRQRQPAAVRDASSRAVA